MFKKLIAAVVTLLLVALPVMADDAQAPIVTVTISDAGTLVMANVQIQLSDADEDGLYTINDALIMAHDAQCPDGFVTEITEYGLSITKLWGVENGGSYSYCVNNASAAGLTQEVTDGDAIYAYGFADLETWSDVYSYFTMDENGSNMLCMNGYDEAWNPVTLAVSGAVITVNGQATEVVTDENGCFDLVAAVAPFAGIEEQVLVSAVSEDLVLVPPVLVVALTESVAE